MKLNGWALGLASLVAVVMVTAPVAASADPIATTLQMQAPTVTSLGNTVTITVTLKDASGNPVPDATVLLYTSRTFLSTAGIVDLDSETTNAAGVAALTYQARSGGDVTLGAAFTGNTSYAAAGATSDITEVGSTQLYQSTAGVRVPGLGVWLLAAVMSIVWCTYLSVMVVITLIAPKGGQPATRLSYAQGGRHE